MDWSDTAEQAAFRAEVREAFADGIPAYYRERAARGLDSDWGQDRRSGDPEREGAANAWTDALFAHGWFAPHLPKEYGGAGMSPMEQFIFTQERAGAG
ncbi:MAG: acyl-CoA dehydrogenase family protein, partial [Chloroflexi bacterium]|nr:acyl-CoA dehydrogenase family protein [Chloroflexota bacterium]